VTPQLGGSATPCPRDPAGRPRRTGSSGPRLQRPQFPVAALARAPCTAAAPEIAPRRGSAGGTWCRRRAPPCPTPAVITAPPTQSADLSDSLRHNLAAAAAGNELQQAGRQAGGRAGAGGPGQTGAGATTLTGSLGRRSSRKGRNTGASEDSDWVQSGVHHYDARGGDYVKRSHAGAPPAVSRRGPPKGPSSTPLRSAFPPSLRLSGAADATALLAILP
jgi:hypothetical protein